jgi:hypothetical protein
MSSFPSGITVYTFQSITFARVADGDSLEPWFSGSGQGYTKDVVLGGASVYLDVGATIYGPLSFRASFLSSADRAAFVALLFTSATLSNTRGRSGTAVLTKATPIDEGLYKQYFCDVAFELLPS